MGPVYSFSAIRSLCGQIHARTQTTHLDIAMVPQNVGELARDAANSFLHVLDGRLVSRSVGRSVSRSVIRSVGQLVGRSECEEWTTHKLELFTPSTDFIRSKQETKIKTFLKPSSPMSLISNVAESSAGRLVRDTPRT